MKKIAFFLKNFSTFISAAWSAGFGGIFQNFKKLRKPHFPSAFQRIGEGGNYTPSSIEAIMQS